jgi:4-hydroxy-tetrahydrodipicolinate reductase
MSEQSIKLAVTGAGGRMGRRIVALTSEIPSLKLTAATECDGHPQLGQDIGLIAGTGPLNVMVSTSPAAKPDVMIDFSLPESTMQWGDYCSKNGIALVIGTTGLSEQQKKILKNHSKNIPLLIAPNMSLGVNLLFQLVGQVARSLGTEYDIEIAEAHHRFKKDAPSGTALELARRIAQDMQWPFPGCLVHGREGKEALRKEKTIGIHAIRGGDTVGIHSVFYTAQGETVEIKHTAHSRDTFARGALRAAAWLATQKPGQYTMADVLGLNA